MPVLPPHEQCTGCTACMAICPSRAISMQPDREGFFCPTIDSDLCTECGRCTRTCPVLHCPAPRQPLAVYAVINKDEETRRQSSSGGMFSLLAQKVLAQGGVVYGAGWSDSLTVTHQAIDDLAGLSELRGSKYVQSDLTNTFSDVRQQVQVGRRILFSGTPCQIAGLRAYLGRSAENLLCVDVVCHAVPSPGCFAAYKLELERRFGSRITGVRFRDKTQGWRAFSVVITFANGRNYSSIHHQDPFMMAFLNELCNRPSCHRCPFRELRSGSDITLADYWGIQNKFPALDDDRGVSLALVNTPEGQRLFDSLKDQVTWASSDYADAQQSTATIIASPSAHANRALFFERFPHRGFARTVRRFTAPPARMRVRRILGRVYRSTLRRWC